MSQFGVFDKSTSKVVHWYVGNRIRLVSPYADLGAFVHFEVAEGNYPEAYFLNEQGSIEYDNTYTPVVNQISLLQEVVQSAISFFNSLMVRTAAENIAMGITQAGKTKDVADYLANVMRYGQTGSLYEVMGEIDTLIAATVPANLDPFVTDARLLAFKQEITDYLT